MISAQFAKCARRFGGFTLGAPQGGVQHVLHQGGFARARHTGDADQSLQRNADVDVLQVVFGDTQQLESGRLRVDGSGGHAGIGAPAAGEVFGGERAIRPQFIGRAEEHHFAAFFAGTGAHVQNAVGGEHDLRIVFHHQQRIAGIAQTLHHADHPAHVARMQANRRFIQHEQGVDQRRPERGGEVDALHLAAGERA